MSLFALHRFFSDGCLRLTNSQFERELRRVATGRNALLFVGGDDHGQAVRHLLSLVASARAHQLAPEAYLRDLFRVLPQWPRDRYLEMSLRDWPATRTRLVAAELEREFGPSPSLAPTSEQPATRRAGRLGSAARLPSAVAAKQGARAARAQSGNSPGRTMMRLCFGRETSASFCSASWSWVHFVKTCSGLIHPSVVVVNDAQLTLSRIGGSTPC